MRIILLLLKQAYVFSGFNTGRSVAPASSRQQRRLREFFKIFRGRAARDLFEAGHAPAGRLLFLACPRKM